MKISCVIICKNEQHLIKTCIESAAEICDEVLVIDDYSEDDSPKIIEASIARLVQNPFESFSVQKNYGNGLATHDWILSLDADERLSDNLKRTLVSLKPNNSNIAYSFNRLNFYCGKPIKRAGWYPDKKVKLFNRKTASWKGSGLHEVLQTVSDVKTVHVNQDIEHYTCNSVRQHVNQVNHFSSIYAKDMGQKQCNLFLLSLSSMIKFWKIYFFKGAFLEGWRGFSIAAISSYSKLLKGLKRIQPD